MPFYRVTIKDNSNEDDLYSLDEDEFESDEEFVGLPTKPSQVPIFLIPSIIPDGTEQLALARQIYLLSKSNRPVYVYYDSRVLNNNPVNVKDKLSLNDQAKNIVNSMLRRLPKGPSPYVIEGYSYGSTLAVLAAQELKRQEQEVHVYLVDGVSPEHSKEYLASKSISCAEMLVSIANYAARLAALKEAVIDESDLAKHVTEPAATIMEFAEQRILSSQQCSDKQKDFFNTLMAVAKQNIQNLINFPGSSNIKLDHITALLTEETIKRYGDESGGWDKYTNKLLLSGNAELHKVKHTDLLKENNAVPLALSIKQFLADELKPRDLRNKLIEFINNANITDDEEEESAAATSDPTTPVNLRLHRTTTSESNDSTNRIPPKAPSTHSEDSDSALSDDEEKSPPALELSERKARRDKSPREIFTLFSRKVVANDVVGNDAALLAKKEFSPLSNK